MSFLPPSITQYLPQHEGLLPKWLLIVSLVSCVNGLQAYLGTGPTRKVYAGRSNEVTPLSARTFGTWTILSGIIRLRAAYAIEQREVYLLAFASVALAWVHFVLEWLVFGSLVAPWTGAFNGSASSPKGKGKANQRREWIGKGSLGPLAVATCTSIWMWTVWDDYVR